MSSPRILAVDGGWRVVFADPTPTVGGPFLVRRDTVSGPWTAPMAVGTFGTDPELGLGDEGMLLVFRRRNALNQDQVIVRPLDLGGAPLAVARSIEPNTNTPPRYRIVWDGTDYHIGYYDGDFILHPVDPMGVPRGSRWTFSSEEDNRADLVYTEGRFAAVWARRDNVYFGTADASRVATQQSIRGADGARDASLDASEDGYLVAWVDAADSPDGRHSLRVLPLEGTVASDSVATLSTTIDDPDDIAPPSVRFGGGQFLVTWSDLRGGTADVYFARVSAQGDVVQPATLLGGREDADEGETAAAYVDGHFGVVWTQRAGGLGETRFAEVACPPASP